MSDSVVNMCMCVYMCVHVCERERLRQTERERETDRLPAYHTTIHLHKSILSELHSTPVIPASPHFSSSFSLSLSLSLFSSLPLRLSMKQIQYTVTLSGPRLAIWILSQSQKGTHRAKLIFLLR